jgi:hypothetical protein
VAAEAVSLIALAALVAVSQWMFTQTVSRVDMRLIPAYSRRRVRWLVVHSSRIYLASAAVFATVVAVQAAVLLS